MARLRRAFFAPSAEATKGKGADPCGSAPLPGEPGVLPGPTMIDQNFFSTETDQVRGRPGTPVTTPSEFAVASLFDMK